MRKNIIIILMCAIFTAPVFAGDIGNIIGVDLMMGIAGGAAMGVAFSTPSYMDGGTTADPTVFLVGAGWGAIAGAIAGLAYGIYGVVDHVNMRNKSTIKASAGSEDIVVEYNPSTLGIQITQKF
jgi:hypothetical protein